MRQSKSGLDFNTQHDLFGQVEPITLSIEKTADKIGVSTATIHNWIKTGYLLSSNGKVLSSSIENFIAEFVGKDKLIARANKLKKDNHNHTLLSNIIENKINSDTFDDNLGEMYQNSLSESFRNKEGIYYTPFNVVKDMMKSITDVENKTFLDPCCGGGNFIMQALEAGFKTENVYGFDTDINAVEITKKRIFNKTGYKTNNIICADFLNSPQQNFDYIFTNPPWGKKLSQEERKQYSIIYNLQKNIDTSSLFFVVCLQRLNNGGKIGFLLPEAFFNISTFEDVRKQALEYKIERFIDYGNIFKGLITKAQAIILSREFANDDLVQCEFENTKFTRRLNSFVNIPKHILNFWAKEDDVKTIEHTFSVHHITLQNNAQWGLGIVTGNNKKICKSNYTADCKPVFRGQDITKEGLKEPVLFINEEDLKFCQQVAPIEYYKAKEKLIYRFISNKLVCFYDNEQRYILNSANMLILKDNFPLSTKQLTDLLNSNFMNWLFDKIFHTHKILRGDLELLPIHTGYFITNKDFDEDKYLNYLQIEIKDGTYRVKR
ncbi:MAG: N-6 DNA methylase [Bacteroidales bacterium]|jgi:site-specific DNA-methyltransferase (adenine-specific)|nr:N-6 DNA methylase [Bacteroidales bacterium]